VACIVGCYYNMIIAWCFYYLFMSFRVRGMNKHRGIYVYVDMYKHIDIFLFV
jgi:hypothetical protein